MKVIWTDLSGRVRGKPFRVLGVGESTSLYDLAYEIVKSFEFDFDHLFGFYSKYQGNYFDSDEKYELLDEDEHSDRSVDVRNVHVSQVFNIPAKRMLFVFDFGDEWRFMVRLLKVALPEPDMEYPVLVESVGEAPCQYGSLEDSNEEGDEEDPGID